MFSANRRRSAGVVYRLGVCLTWLFRRTVPHSRKNCQIRDQPERESATTSLLEAYAMQSCRPVKQHVTGGFLECQARGHDTCSRWAFNEVESSRAENCERHFRSCLSCLRGRHRSVTKNAPGAFLRQNPSDLWTNSVDMSTPEIRDPEVVVFQILLCVEASHVRRS